MHAMNASTRRRVPISYATSSRARARVSHALFLIGSSNGSPSTGMASSASPTASAMLSPDPLQQDLSWLNALSVQAIFSPSQGGAGAAADGAAAPPPSTTTMVLRGSDVIVLADGELRIMSLSSLKNSVGSQNSSSTSPSTSYKVSAASGSSDVASQRLTVKLSPCRPCLILSSRKRCLLANHLPAQRSR